MTPKSKESCQLSVANRNLIHSASILSLTTLFYVHFRDCEKNMNSAGDSSSA